MPVSFSSAARNLFLLGSSGADVVSNFFKQIEKDVNIADVYVTSSIKYSEYDERYILSGHAQDPNSRNLGFIEKRQDNGTEDWGVTLNGTASENLVIADLEVDSNDNLIAVGHVGDVPFISRYDSNGVLDWQSTSNTADLKYKGVATTANGYYACGNTPVANNNAVSFVEKYDLNGNSLWGKAATVFGSDIQLLGIHANSRGEVVVGGWLDDETYVKGYFAKLDQNTGEVLWDRTLSLTDRYFGAGNAQACTIMDVHVDGNDFIYVVGSLAASADTNDTGAGFICKYTPEGNMLWQRETPLGGTDTWRYFQVEVDTATGQIAILGRYLSGLGDKDGILVKYSESGQKIFARLIESNHQSVPTFGNILRSGGGIGLDADSSFYYIIFTDESPSAANQTPNSYTFGKVSTSGNGLGDFVYDTGATEGGNPVEIEYRILDFEDRIGRLSDGSVRYDTSDLATNVLNPTRIMFDDYATPVTNKKRQMDSAGTFQYSGSPAIRPVDFGSMNVMGDVGASDGPELVQNGTFDSDVSGWTAETSTISWNSGRLQTNRTGGSGYTSYQAIPTEIGKRYTVRATVDSTGTGGRQDIRVLSDVSANNNILLSSSPVNGSNGFIVDVELYFTAVGTTSYVYTTSDAGGTGFFDNISVKESAIWSDRSGKGNNAIVNGPTYNSGGGYWEFDATDYRIIFGPKCNELFEDGGGGTIEMWVRLNDVSTRQTLCSGYVTSGPTQPDRWDFEVQNGLVRGGFHDNGYSQSNPILSTNTWYNFMFVLDKSSGNGEIRFYINGVEESNWSGSLTVDRDFATDVKFGIGNRFSQQTDFPLDGDIAEVRVYPTALTEAQVFQNYNSTKSKYINEAPDVAPKIGPDIVYDSNLLLNYDFGNRATYDRAENLIANNEVRYTADGGIWQDIGRSTLEYGFDDPFGTKTATKVTRTTGDGLIRIPNYTLTGDGPWTFSAYAKIISGSGDIRLDISDFSPAKTSQTISKDEWTRVEFTYQTSEVNTGASADYLDIECGPGITEWLIAGIQLERGSTAGRPIRTYGSVISPPTTFSNLVSSDYNETIPTDWAFTDDSFTCDGSGTFTNNSILNFDPVIPHENGFAVGYTWEAWVKINTFTNIANAYLFRSYPGGSSIQAGAYFGQSGSLQGKLFLETNNNTASGPNNFAMPDGISEGVWSHFVVTGTHGSTYYQYYNGTAVGAYAANSTFVPMRLARFGSGTGTDMSFGEVRCYDRELSAAEVLRNYNATRSKYGV